MSLNDITNKVNELASDWQQFKAINDRRLKEVEKKGATDPVTLTHLEKLNKSIDSIETALNRPNSEAKSITSYSDNLEHKNAFCGYLRRGTETGLADLEKKSLSVSNDADGGYFVTSYMSDKIAKAIHETSPMRKLANVTSISTDALEIIEDKGEAFAGWTQETDPRPDTPTPQISKKVIQVHELYAQPKATQKLIDDSSIDIEAWLAGKLIDVFSRKENAAFINGDGKGKPRGILKYANGQEWGKIEQIKSGADGKVTADSLMNLFYSLKEPYAVGAKFLMSRAAVQAVRMLKSSSGNYLWQPSLGADTPDTLLGAEVVQAADMPGMEKGSLAIAFGDFSTAYQIVDRQGIKVLRDPFTDKPFVKFYSTKRTGGDVVNFEALKLLKLSA